MRYRMTDDELTELREACKPVTYIVVGGMPPESPRTKAMRVWRKIAKCVGCSANSIKPAGTGDDRDFDATPKESKP